MSGYNSTDNKAAMVSICDLLYQVKLTVVNYVMSGYNSTDNKAAMVSICNILYKLKFVPYGKSSIVSAL